MTIGFILLASTYLSSPVAANMPDPTFDTLKEQAAALSENYMLTESTGTLPDGAVEVTIGEKKIPLSATGKQLSPVVGPVRNAGRLFDRNFRRHI